MEGMIQIYTGNGKGKTTAAMGLALRACGAGLRVYIGQFVKDMKYAEVRLLEQVLPQIQIEQLGRGCFIRREPGPADRQAAQQGLARVAEQMKGGRYDLLILDEPVNGLDPVGMKEMRILFRRLVQEEGMTILMSSHLLSEIEQIADRVGVIVDGTIMREAEMTGIWKQHSSDMEDYFISLIQGGADHA